MAYLLGIDIGTSGTKTVLFSETGTAIASATYEYSILSPKPGWAEQDPATWWRACLATLREVMAKSGVDPSDIKGIGLSGQMHGLVMLDSSGQVLRDSIIWCDQRTARECEQIESAVGRERLIAITANPALTGFTASKILWVRNNQPEIYEKCAKIMLPKDYIRYMLTGEFATEVSDASGMQLLDVPNRCWSDEVLQKLQIDRSLLCPVYESAQVSGKISNSASQLIGLAIGTPVVGGAGDQAAGAVGNGIVRNGIVSSTIGTSGVVFAHTNKVTIDPHGRVHTFCHAVPNAWHVMGVTQGAGLSLKWFRDNFCENEIDVAGRMGVDPYVLLDFEAAKILAGCEGLMYLPYMMGERSPHLDPSAKAVFFGLSPRHNKSSMLRAVMEGVTYSLRDCIQIIEGMGIAVSEVRASGGGAKSTLWKQMQADIFNTPMVCVAAAEGPALGVALLAGTGVGIWSSVSEACEAAVMRESVLNPIPDNVDVYNRFYRIYRDLYPALKSQYKALSQILER